MARRQVPQPLGLMESSPAGSVPLGHTDEETNVRDWDERGQRARTASRSGLLRLGDTAPCPASSPVTHAFTAKRALSRNDFVELTNTPDDTSSPTQVSEEWESAFASRTPVDSAVGPDGIAVVLFGDGSVATVTDRGAVTDVFTVPVPFGFTLVPSVAVDDLGAIYVGASFEREIDGGASRVYRWTRDEDGIWTQQYEQVVPDRIERFWVSDTDLFATTIRPDNVDEQDQARYTLTRYGGIIATGWSVAWQRPAPEPTVEMAFQDSGQSVFLAAPPRGGRAPQGGVTADVQWTPRELRTSGDTAPFQLFSWLSALREQNVRGLTPGTRMNSWDDARFDTSEWDDVFDTTTRRAVDSSNTVGPVFQEDPDGFGPEVRFDRALTLDPERLLSGANTSNALKSTAEDVADWQKALCPTMDGSGFGEPNPGGHRFATTILFRMESYEEGTVTHLTPKIVFQQGNGATAGRFRLYYTPIVDGSQATVSFEIVGPGGTLTTRTSSAINLGENGAHVVATIINGGWGISSASSFRVNGVQVGSAFTWDYQTSLIGCQTNIGWAGVDAYDSVNNMDGFARFRGSIKEWITYLGNTTSALHDTTPSTVADQDVELMEGYAVNAYGVQSILAGSGHSYVNGPPGTAGGTPPNFGLEAALADPNGLLVKLERSTGAVKWIRSASDCGNGVAVAGDNTVYTIGTPIDLASADPIRLSRLTDNGDGWTREWSVEDVGTGADTIWQNERIPLYADAAQAVYVPWVSRGSVAASELRKYGLASETPLWRLPLPEGPQRALPGGLFVDKSDLGGAKADEFVYVTSSSAIHRVEVLGRQDTGETRPQEAQVVAACESGVVARLTDSGWEQLAPVSGVEAFLPGSGDRPWSFEMYGRHYFGGPEDYRVWDPRVGQLREWTPNENSLIPSRIFTAVRWRGRAIVVSEDDRHILYGSAFGAPTDFQTGGETVTATQAFAGTTAATGAIPDPVVALMPSTDDLLYVGTNRSVWRITGDPQTGGQLDDVLASEGVLDTNAWCRGDAGEMYWMTTTRRVVQLGSTGLVDISSTSIRGRLQRVDAEEYRIEMVYSDREQGLYVYFIPRSGSPETGIEHLFWSKRSQRWHPVQFAGGIDRALTAGGVLENADSGGWGAMFGFADGWLRFMHPEALDDDGVPIASRMRIPITGDGDPQRGLIQFAELVLDPRQGPVRVVGVAGRTGDTGDDYGQETVVQPGRGDVVNVAVSGSHTWLEVIGTGEPWAIDAIAVDVHLWGAA